jgi:hypothetical protein
VSLCSASVPSSGFASVSADRAYAVILLPTPPDWRPKFDRSPLPNADLKGIDVRSAAEFVVKFNAGDFARARRRWALLQAKGGVVFLFDMDAADRPDDPAELPAGAVTVGLTRYEAIDEAASLNRESLAVAFVPRRWAVAVRHPGDTLAALNASDERRSSCAQAGG